MGEVFGAAVLVTQNAEGNALVAEGTQAPLRSQKFFLFNNCHPFLGVDSLNTSLSFTR